MCTCSLTALAWRVFPQVADGGNGLHIWDGRCNVESEFADSRQGVMSREKLLCRKRTSCYHTPHTWLVVNPVRISAKSYSFLTLSESQFFNNSSIPWSSLVNSWCMWLYCGVALCFHHTLFRMQVCVWNGVSWQWLAYTNSNCGSCYCFCSSSCRLPVLSNELFRSLHWRVQHGL
jgi:hypothetical protein